MSGKMSPSSILHLSFQNFYHQSASSRDSVPLRTSTTDIQLPCTRCAPGSVEIGNKILHPGRFFRLKNLGKTNPLEKEKIKIIFQLLNHPIFQVGTVFIFPGCQNQGIQEIQGELSRTLSKGRSRGSKRPFAAMKPKPPQRGKGQKAMVAPDPPACIPGVAKGVKVCKRKLPE